MARAREVYQRAVTSAPDNADLWAWYAVFLSTRGDDPAAATAAYERAIATDPEHGFALSNYALFRYSRSMDAEGTERLFVRALEVEPDRWSTHWWFAAFLAETHDDRTRAAKHYRRAVELQPAHATLLRQYQSFLEGAGASGDPQSFDAPRPSQVDAISDRGYIHEQSREFVDAEESYRSALKVDPEHGPTLRRFAALLEQRARHREAEALLRRAVELAPRDGWAHGLLARFLARDARDPSGADSHYRQAIAAGLHDPKWLGEYARFLDTEMGEPERAEQYYRRALSTEPTAEVAVDYGRFLEARGEIELAQARFEFAAELAPRSAYPVRQLARFLDETLGDPDAADVEYRRATAIAPNDPLTLSWYARFLDARREDYAGAAIHFRRAALAEPDNASRWGALCRFLIAHRSMGEAREALRRWLDADEPERGSAEPSFLGVVYLDEPERAACFERLKRQLRDGEPIERFDPSPHLEHVRAQERADAPWVERIARVLVERM